MENNNELGSVISIELIEKKRNLIQFLTHNFEINMSSMFSISVKNIEKPDTKYYFSPVSILLNKSEGKCLVTAKQIGYYNNLQTKNLEYFMQNYIPVSLVTDEETINQVHKQSTYC